MAPFSFCSARLFDRVQSAPRTIDTGPEARCQPAACTSTPRCFSPNQEESRFQRADSLAPCPSGSVSIPHLWGLHHAFQPFSRSFFCFHQLAVTAWDTFLRFSARSVLWLPGFPLGKALRSPRSAGPCGPLFARFTTTMGESDFLVLHIAFVYSYSQIVHPVRLPENNQDLPGPGKWRADVHGS